MVKKIGFLIIRSGKRISKIRKIVDDGNGKEKQNETDRRTGLENQRDLYLKIKETENQKHETI